MYYREPAIAHAVELSKVDGGQHLCALVERLAHVEQCAEGMCGLVHLPGDAAGQACHAPRDEQAKEREKLQKHGSVLRLRWAGAI